MYILRFIIVSLPFCYFPFSLSNCLFAENVLSYFQFSSFCFYPLKFNVPIQFCSVFWWDICSFDTGLTRSIVWWRKNSNLEKYSCCRSFKYLLEELKYPAVVFKGDMIRNVRGFVWFLCWKQSIFFILQ